MEFHLLISTQSNHDMPWALCVCVCAVAWGIDGLSASPSGEAWYSFCPLRVEPLCVCVCVCVWLRGD